MVRRRKSGNHTIILSAAVILIIIAAAWGYFALLEEQGEQLKIEHYELSEEFYGNPDPVAPDHLSYSREGLSASEINNLLDDTFELLINEEDITADGYQEFVVIENNPLHSVPHESLRQDGYEQAIGGLIIYRKIDESLVPIFILTPEAMRDESGNKLLGQIQADHGYALHVYDHDDERVYAETVKLFDVVLLDEQGDAASDVITIYWDSGSNRYRATNTFGAPGTFSE